VAFKITKAEQKTIDELVAKFSTARADLELSVATYNETVNEARGKIDDSLAALNEIRDELRGVVEDIHSEKDGEFDDKSDNWKDGDRGSATREWIDGIEEVKDLIEEEITIEPFEELEIDLSEIEDKLEEGIPSEPEY
jgi:hypothetical protein